MRKDEQDSLFGYLLFFVLYILILFALFRLVFKVAKWSAPGFWNCIVKPKPAVYDMIRGVVGVTLVYAIAVFAWPEMLNSISIGFGAAFLTFIASKIVGYRIWARKKRSLQQMEYASVDGQEMQLVHVNRLSGVVSPALSREMKQAGINHVVKAARKVPWADQLIIASTFPGAGIRHAAKAAGEERISSYTEYFPRRGRLP